MSPGLTYLLRASYGGFFRRMGRRMRTVRGFVSTLFGGLFFLLLIGSQALAIVLAGPTPGEHSATVQGFSLLMLLFLVPALMAAEAPFFWPQEVQFLFPAPLSRRELLLYQMLSRGQMQIFSGLWFGVMSMRLADKPVLAFPAIILGLLFLFALTQLAGLAKTALDDRLPRSARRGMQGALTLAVAVAGFAFWRRTQAAGFNATVGEVFASPWMKAATLPGRPFGELFAARSWGAAGGWGALCVALVLAAGAVAIWPNVDFRERSLVSSAKKFERLRRMRTNRSSYAATPAKRRLPVPALAFLGQAAPVARRQLFELGRGLRSLWSLLFAAALAFFYVILMPRFTAGDVERMRPLGTSLVVLAIVFPLLASGTFTLDFRRDIERMAYLRSLPLPPRAVAVGQVFTASVIIACMNLVLLGVAMGTADGRIAREMALVAGIAAVPVAWLAVTLENWLFLLFPTRMQADGGQQNAFVGKQILKLLFKLFVLAAVAGLAAAAAWGGDRLAGDAGAAASAALVVALACVAITALLARAFRGFDLTVDTPA